ncbi:F-box/LRR-repeat protein At4g14103-like isoform X2 [Papaver somniferum]|nr:F-box/LRR-repeat protein At4g14103-like isoform X2 [Papaver somniferum]
MDLNDREAAAGKDRISNLTYSLIHHILSFLEIKQVSQTSVLSKQWRCIWTSIPILVFHERTYYHPDSYSQANKFMDFVDGTLLRRNNMSDIEKFSLTQGNNLNEYRVSSWITNVISRNVQELILSLRQEDPFIIPISLCTCVSLISLTLEITPSICFPRNVSFPKLKHLTLRGVLFSNECWNEKLFSKCPVLEDLILAHCTYDTRNFCISVTTLKILRIHHWGDQDGLRDCGLQIHAPNLVSLSYQGWVPKEFVLYTSPKLVEAHVLFFGEYVVATREQRKSCNTSIIQFLRALTHVNRLIVFNAMLEALSADNLLENLPTFHNTKQLILREDIADKALIALLKATPNLESLVFDKIRIDDAEEDDVAGNEAEETFNHDNEDDDWILNVVTPGSFPVQLKSVCFKEFIANPKEMKWVQLILKNAKALQTLTISSFQYSDLLNGKTKELMMELTSLPRASTSCTLKFPSWRS